MGTAFVSGTELTLVVATAVTVSLAGMWLARRFTVPSSPTVRRAPPKPATSRTTPIFARAAQRSRADAPRRYQRRTEFLCAGPIRAALNEAHSKISAVVRQILAAQSVRRAKAKAPQTRPLTSSSVRAKTSAPTAFPKCLSIESQWERAERTVARALLGTQTLRNAHAAAGDKIDAAHYALEKMLAELEGIMSLKPLSAEVALFPGAPNKVRLRDGTAQSRVAA